VTLADSIASLPPLRDVIKEAALSARKSLGQNFILDLNVTRRIARSAGPLTDVTVLEIGPGPGGLTRGLLLEGAAGVVAIERDERFRPALSQIEARSGGRFKALFMDALESDYAAIAAETGASRVVANLPYNIATPLVVAWLSEEHWPPWFDKLVVMVQREVADRFFAMPRSKAYGAVSVLVQLRARRTGFHRVSPTVFRPPPRVDSALVAFERISGVAVAAGVRALVEAAFAHRRKTLANSVALGGLATRARVEEALAAIGRLPGVRAEELEPSEFVALAEALA